MSSLVERAERFARRAHGSVGQRRKYSGEPYAVHLRAVAERVASVTDDEETIAAAWLHDALEDTPVKVAEIKKRFGAGVAALVAELTDRSRPGDGNRSRRKAIDRRHLAGASPRAKTVKLADLIDNCRDIAAHDEKFARVYLGEMRLLLGVLTGGDAALLHTAREVWRECALAVGLDTAALEAEEGGDAATVPPSGSSMQRRMRRLLNEGIPAAYIAEALPSFDAERDAAGLRAFMEKRGLEVVGIRRDGIVAGYARAEDLGAGACGNFLRPFREGQTVFADAALSRVIDALSRFDHCFVSVLGSVGAVISREDIQKPPVRMWLFGMIGILEMYFSRKIEELYPGDSWGPLLTPSRLAKAKALLEERRERGQRSRLLDCLQLSDKARVLLKDPQRWGDYGLETKRDSKRAVKALESLRNNLAHAQDIVTHDWEAIVLIARRVDRIVTRL